MDRQHNRSVEKNSKGQGQSSENPKTEAGQEKVRVCVGLDISTTCTAIVVLNSKTGELVYMEHVLMNNKNKLPTFWDKVTFMEEAINRLPDANWAIDVIAIEESAKRFSPGFSSADTIITLARFNGIISFVMYKKYGLTPTYINVRTARKHVGVNIDYKDKSKSTKQKVLNIVVAMNPDYPWVYKLVKEVKSLTKINEDRADAWVMAESARKLFAGKR